MFCGRQIQRWAAPTLVVIATIQIVYWENLNSGVDAIPI